jgi:hypothetical protein
MKGPTLAIGSDATEAISALDLPGAGARAGSPGAWMDEFPLGWLVIPAESSDQTEMRSVKKIATAVNRLLKIL